MIADLKSISREPGQAIACALDLLRAGGTHEQAEEILVTALSRLSQDAQDTRGQLMLQAWIAACMVLREGDREVEAKAMLDRVIPGLRAAAAVTGPDEDLTAALATAETAAGWIAVCTEDDATAHIHFRRAIQTYDSCIKCEPEDVLFAAYLFIVTSMDPDLSPRAMYEWAKPYLEVLPPLHCKYGAQLLDLIGDWFLLEGEAEDAKRMFTKLLDIANVDAAHETSRRTVQDLVEGARRKLRDAAPDGV